MATRSAIGIITDHYIYGIYCYWDGYVKHNGHVLLKHYNTFNQVWNLIKLGDLSDLGKEIGECVHCEMKNPYSSFITRAEFKDKFERSGCEYFYLFKDNQWLMSTLSSDWAPVETYSLAA